MGEYVTIQIAEWGPVSEKLIKVMENVILKDQKV